MSLKDTDNGYGWVSIVLHWITTIAIFALLYIGSSIEAYVGESRVMAVRLHTSIAVCAYVFLWGRIIWRLVYSHPGPTSGQRGLSFLIGKWVHYVILIALALMLVSGPLMAWSGSSGGVIEVFDWFALPAPFEAGDAFRDFMHAIHRRSAIVVFLGILLHLGGVYKHTAFNQDGTLVKMVLPSKRG
jgi:cytochrome b561